MIQNANNKLLTNTNSALPNMSNTITSWFLNITLKIVGRAQSGADWVEITKETINTKGVVQPPRDEDLKILPIGTWSWDWQMLHCLPNVNLETNQFVKYDNITYKVMGKKDFTKYGYIRYMLLEAFQADSLQ